VGAPYTLARAHALNGNSAEAIAILDHLAERGVILDLAKDASLASLRGAAGFERVIQKMATLEAPVGTSRVAFTLPDKTLITEGVAHDAKTGAFFVSSVRQRKIVRIGRDGVAKDFCASGQGGLYAVTALALDAERRLLFASSQAFPQMEGYQKEERDRSFVAVFDVDTGKLLRKIAPPASAADGQLSDLALRPNGDLAVADPNSGRVYLLTRGASELRVVVEKGPLGSAQGMAWTAVGSALFVADYVQGIAKVDVGTGNVVLLDAPADAVLTGIDGLAWADGSLVAIQNGVRPHRVARLRLDASLQRIEEVALLERGHPSFDEPTLGTRVGDLFYYVANSQYDGVREDGSLVVEKLKPPVILSLRLPWIVSPPKH
jgi:sugar lactone lactonase YvrE